MIDKTYIVITDAPRERIFKSESHPYAKRNQYQYRTGELGLIHPKVVEHFESGRIPCRLGSPDLASVALPDFRDKDIPVLRFRLKDTFRPEDYFISVIREGEFARLLGVGKEDVLQGVREAYEHIGLSYYGDLQKRLDM